MAEAPDTPQLFVEPAPDESERVIPEVTPGQLAPGESPTYDPNARPDSEARIDQGHGKREPAVRPLLDKDNPELKQAVSRHPANRHRPFELPGKNGRTNQQPNLRPDQAQAGKTDAEITDLDATMKAGVKAARNIVRKSIQPKET